MITGNILNYLPEHAHLDGIKAYEYQSPQDLQHILQQIHDFLIYEQQYCENFEKLSHWLNYGEGKKGILLKKPISHLLLAKYLNDPNYDHLVMEFHVTLKNDLIFKNYSLKQFFEHLDKMYKTHLKS